MATSKTDKAAKTPIKKTKKVEKKIAKKTASKADSGKQSIIKHKPSLKEEVKNSKFKKDFQSVKDDMNRKRKGGSWGWFGTSLLFLLASIIIAGIGFGAVYLYHQEAKETVLEYFEGNDYRRGEQLYATLQEQSIDPEVVLTHYDVRRPVYSLVYSNPNSPDQQLVEVNYLKHDGFLKYKVMKSFRVIVTGDLDKAKDLAQENDLYLDSPDTERMEVTPLQDLDLPPSQRDQAQQQLEAQAENQRRALEFEQADNSGKIQILTDLKQEASDLKDAVERGATEFNGEPIPAGFDTTQIDSYLAQLEQNIKDLQSGDGDQE